jgi:hypothetical protein
MVDVLALVLESCAARLHDAVASELPYGDTQVTIWVLAEDTLPAVGLIARDDVISCNPSKVSETPFKQKALRHQMYCDMKVPGRSIKAGHGWQSAGSDLWHL